MIESVFKTKPWMHKIKDLNGQTIIGSFYEKELLLSYYRETDIKSLEIRSKQYQARHIMLLKMK